VLTPDGDAEEIATLVTYMGPAGRVVDHFGGDEDDLAAICDAILPKCREFETPSGLRIPATVNLFQGRAPES
jgi:hypothetical protein